MLRMFDRSIELFIEQKVKQELATEDLRASTWSHIRESEVMEN